MSSLKRSQSQRAQMAGAAFQFVVELGGRASAALQEGSVVPDDVVAALVVAAIHEVFAYVPPVSHLVAHDVDIQGTPCPCPTLAVETFPVP